MTDTLYRRLLRPLLFRLSADRAHDLARLSLRWPAVWRVLSGRDLADARLRIGLAGIALHNPIGLAPGFDKNAELLPSLARLGFGYLVAGSITREPRFGNPYPRLVRYPDRQSISNSMGLPNAGLAAARRNLARPRPSTPVIASVAGFSAEELVESAAALAPLVDAVEIGLVCPNTTETERLEEMRIFSRLTEALARDKTKPVFIKLPPYHNEPDRARTMRMLDACIEAGIDGVSVSGTRPIVEPRLGAGKGSLAGRDVFDGALRIVEDVAQHAAGRLAIKAAGGVFSGRDAYRMLAAGAHTVELYSAFIYRGWNVARRIAQELLEVLDEEGIASLADLKARQMASGVTGIVRSTTP